MEPQNTLGRDPETRLRKGRAMTGVCAGLVGAAAQTEESCGEALVRRVRRGLHVCGVCGGPIRRRVQRVQRGLHGAV